MSKRNHSQPVPEHLTPEGVVATPVVGADPNTHPARRQPSVAAATRARIPWILAASFAALSLVLGTLLVVDTIEIHRLRKELAVVPATTATPGTPAATAKPIGRTIDPSAIKHPSVPVITPQPTTGAQADMLKRLAHRDPKDPLAIGKPDAPIVLIEWADYRCPFCARWHTQTLPALMPYVKSGSLRIEFRDMVLFGDESQIVHQAVRAAGAQGKYFEYADLVWDKHTGQGHPDYTDADLVAYAHQIGLDITKFNIDRAAPVTRDAVTAETTEGRRLGISGTPFFVVGTTPVSGALPTESFVNLVEAYGGKK